MATEKTRQINSTVTVIGVLVGEVKARKNILFRGLSSDVTNKRKASEWQHVVTAVSHVRATERSVPEVKKSC